MAIVARISETAKVTGKHVWPGFVLLLSIPLPPQEHVHLPQYEVEIEKLLDLHRKYMLNTPSPGSFKCPIPGTNCLKESMQRLTADLLYV